MHAAREGHWNVVNYLLSNKRGLQVNLLNANKWTALMMAAANGHEKVIKALLRGGAEDRVAGAEKSASDLARKAGHDEIVAMLK